jgi:methylmalonyl-CoA mutase cobalamin-binding subunit
MGIMNEKSSKAMKQKTIVAGALGECVHVAGVTNFLRLAEAAGWRTVFLGPAVSVEEIIAAAQREDAEMVGVSYRLTPETGERLLGQFAEAASEFMRMVCVLHLAERRRWSSAFVSSASLSVHLMEASLQR